MLDYDLTVCIPCFNEEDRVEVAIESLLNQSYKDFNIIVIDDASKDKTIDKVKQFEDERIKIIKNKRNLGLYENYNKCLQIASSKYLKIYNADDILDANCLSLQLKAIEQNKNVLLVFGASEIINPEGKVLLTRRHFSEDRQLAGKKMIAKNVLGSRNFIGEPTGVLFDLNFAKSEGLTFNSKKYKHMADLGFWMQLLEFGDAYYLNKILFKFRVHPSSGTATLLKNSIREHELLLQEYVEIVKPTLIDIIVFKFKSRIYYLLKKIFFIWNTRKLPL